MLSGTRIVCLSSLPLGGLTTSRHHLARILAEDNEVLFVDPPGNAARGARAAGGLHDEGGRIVRLEAPPHLPYGPLPLFLAATPWNQRTYARAVRAAVDELGWRDVVLWNASLVYPAPGVAPLLRPSVHFLHLTDSLWDYPWYRPRYERFLRRIIDTVDFTVGSSADITARLATYGRPAHHLPHGVDIDVFGRVARGEVEPHPAMADRPRPRLGFVGNVEARFDVELACALASGAGSLTVVGPRSLHPAQEDALRRAGCHLVDAVAYHEVPTWLAGFDIAVVPYRRNRLVEVSRPLKLLEYLGAGLPVVSIDIPAARELAPEVAVADSAGAFAAAVGELWARGEAQLLGPPARAARVELARPHSWRHRAAQLRALVATASGD